MEGPWKGVNGRTRLNLKKNKIKSLEECMKEPPLLFDFTVQVCDVPTYYFNFFN